MTIVIPMAGKGERFSKKGYTIPKPLIPVNGVPMVVKAVNDLPVGDSVVFIALEDHLKRFNIDTEIKKNLPDASFITLSEVTEGQACTGLLGLSAANLNDELLIGACDNGMIFNREAFNEKKKDADVLVFTFRNNVTVKEKPQQYGWVKVTGNDTIDYVSVKKPISDTPMKDHAIIGAFWFKEASIFKLATEQMISQNRRINNEFYIDECINDAVSLGYHVRIFEVDKYVCWGTPDDYLTYNYWQSFFNNL